jgi:hypothetical protein
MALGPQISYTEIILVPLSSCKYSSIWGSLYLRASHYRVLTSFPIHPAISQEFGTILQERTEGSL